MYSPRIAEDLVSLLYHKARAEKVPMTRLTDRLLREAIARQSSGTLHPSVETRDGFTPNINQQKAR